MLRIHVRNKIPVHPCGSFSVRCPERSSQTYSYLSACVSYISAHNRNPVVSIDQLRAFRCIPSTMYMRPVNSLPSQVTDQFLFWTLKILGRNDCNVIDVILHALTSGICCGYRRLISTRSQIWCGCRPCMSRPRARIKSGPTKTAKLLY